MTHLDLLVLGPVRVFVDGIPVKSFRSAKTRALLVYLAMESNRPHTRDALAELLWPDQPNQTARDNLRQTLAILRKAIGDGDAATSPLLDITRNTIQLNPSGDFSLDALAFGAHIQACAKHRHRHSDTCRVCAQSRSEAVALYGGNFLDQFFLSDSAPFEEWALLNRERLKELALNALGQLAEFHMHCRNHSQALAFARKQLILDPWREEAHRQAMRALALDGQPSAALAQYEDCRRVLADEMGVEPAQETIALYETLKNQADRAPGGNELFAVLVHTPECSVPSPVTPLFGREHELAELDRLLSDPGCRLISIIGPGGAGKTRLAIAAAAEQKADFDDGIFFVSLSPIESSRLIAPTILSTLGVPLRGQKDPAQQLISHLRERQVLLVLDNMEHLLDCAPILAELLRRAPRVALLVTSRERLNLRGEWVLDLQGLEIPEGQKVEDVDHFAAVRLFLESAKRGRPASSFSDEEKAIIVRICRMVEGMPLAIELAAAWVRTLSCREIAEEIEKSFGFLTAAFRDVAPRHKSMRAVFDHSWNLLNNEEQCVLRRLSVFQGGFDREGAEQVAGASLGLLAALVDKSLVRPATPERYDLHNLVRQFAQEQLEEADETHVFRRKHAEYYLGVAEAAFAGLDSPDQARWLQRLEMDNANLREALAWSTEDADQVEVALRLCGALARSWDMRGYASEGRRWLDLALDLLRKRFGVVGGADAPEAAASSIPAVVLLKAFTAAGSLAFIQGDHLVARSFHHQALQLCQGTENQAAQATCYLNLGNAANHLGEYAEGRAFHEQGLAIYRALGNKAGVSRILLNMGVAAHNQGDYPAARSLYEESLALRRELGDQYGIALVLGNLGMIKSLEGEHEGARTLVEESLSIRRSLGDQHGIANCLIALADLAHTEQDYARARGLYHESLPLLETTGSTETIASCLEMLADVDVSQGRVELGVQLWGAADAIREALATPLPPTRRAPLEETWAQARTACGEAAFERAWQSGRAMTTAEAVACALESE